VRQTCQAEPEPGARGSASPSLSLPATFAQPTRSPVHHSAW
jgi:hypothetical protein